MTITCPHCRVLLALEWSCEVTLDAPPKPVDIENMGGKTWENRL